MQKYNTEKSTTKDVLTAQLQQCLTNLPACNGAFFHIKASFSCSLYTCNNVTLILYKHLHYNIYIYGYVGSWHRTLWAKDEERSVWSGTKRDCLWLLWWWHCGGVYWNGYIGYCSLWLFIVLWSTKSLRLKHHVQKVFVNKVTANGSGAWGLGFSHLYLPLPTYAIGARNTCFSRQCFWMQWMCVIVMISVDRIRT